MSREVEDRAIENVRAVREAVGDDVDLLIEVHRRLAPMHARRVARRSSSTVRSGTRSLCWRRTSMRWPP